MADYIDSYHRGAYLMGTAVDVTTGITTDAGMVILGQNKGGTLVGGAADVFFQIPPFVRIKEIYIDIGAGGAGVTAGTYTIGFGTAATVAATPRTIAIGQTLSAVRTQAGYANPDPAALAIVGNTGANNYWMRVSLAAVVPATPAYQIFVTYAILPTNTPPVSGT